MKEPLTVISLYMMLCRRQWQVHQIEKNIKKKCQQTQTQRCLQAWRSVIQRKHESRKFHEDHLVRRMFNHWNTRARRQLRSKKLERMEKVMWYMTVTEKSILAVMNWKKECYDGLSFPYTLILLHHYNYGVYLHVEQIFYLPAVLMNKICLENIIKAWIVSI